MANEMHTLDNGVTVLLNPNPNTEVISLGYGLRVGLRFETEKENGITHFLEHMAFKADTPEETLRIVEDLEGAGGFTNAFTSRNITFYHVTGVSEHFDLFNHHMANIALNAVIPAKELEIERGNIIGEIGQAFDDPEVHLNNLVFGTAFPNHPLGRTVLGPKKNVAGFKRDNFVKFLDKHYHTGNAVFVASGKLDTDYVLDSVKEATRLLKKGNRSKFKKAEYHSGTAHHERSIDQLHLDLCFNAASLNDGRDAKAEKVLGMILGGGMSSRLFQEVREKKGLGYSIGASAQQMKDVGLFSIEAAINPEGAKAFLEATTGEIKKVLQDGVTEAEVARVISLMKTQFAASAESSPSNMDSMLFTFDAVGRPKEAKEVLEEYDEVMVQDVNKAAQRVFSSEPVMATVGPGEHMPKPKKLEKALKL